MVKDVFGQAITYSFIKMEENDGLYHPPKKLIEISTRLQGKDLALALIHEEMHAIIDVLGFNHIIHEEIEELLVDNLSRWISDNYTLSPK